MLTVTDAALLLNVSKDWIYRHRRELPHARVGKNIRFDSLLLLRHFQSKYPVRTGSRLEPKGVTMGLKRYQRGYVKKLGKKQKVWYGGWRKDVPLADGGFTRQQVKRRIGTVIEFPTKSAAYEELSRLMGSSGKPSIEMTFAELEKRWREAVLPTIRETTADYYSKILNAHIVPVFGHDPINSIGRYDVEKFLASRSGKYCRNSLRGMRVSMGRVLSWAVSCGWLEKNPCSGVKLPQAGFKVVRTILSPEQIIAIAKKLNEPYSTLVLFLAVTGLRIGEAIAIKWTDFDGDVLNVSRRIYEGKEGATKTKKSERSLPIPHVLLVRMKALGGSEFVFRSLTGTPVNPGNALKRYVRPTIRELGIAIGGWHDFRHTLNTTMRKNGWSAKVRSDVLGHSTVNTTEQIYDHSDREDFKAALDEIAAGLLPDATKSLSLN
jgi:excisionase family DNA binding protein